MCANSASAGARLRPDAAARRRQPDGRRDHRAAGAHHAGASEARHPAEPRRRRAVEPARSPASSSSACATACGPTRWARPGGSAIADRSGAITPWCASRPSASIASCRCCRAGRRSAGPCSRTTRSRRRSCASAGYEVRVLPDERGSWEENPPTVLEFSPRDLRWCQGNMQYFTAPRPAGSFRHEPLPARLGDPDVPRRACLTLMIALVAPEAAGRRGPGGIPGRRGGRPLPDLPRGCIWRPSSPGSPDILLTKGGVSRYGGAGAFLAGAAIEIVFSFLLGAVDDLPPRTCS